MANQTQRLEIATVNAEIGSNILFRFANDALDDDPIPTDSGDIQNLKQVINEVEESSPFKLTTWALTQAFQIETATRDANGAITTANIIWPDETTGVFTTDVASTAFPGAIDAWHATYASTPAKTITQPTVTRDASGAVIAQPAITIV